MNKLLSTGLGLIAIGVLMSLGNMAAQRAEAYQWRPLAYWAGAFWVAGWVVLLVAGGRWLYRRGSAAK